jgi:Amt family ammonium transporter
MKRHCSSLAFLFAVAIFIVFGATMSSEAGAIIGELPRPAANPPVIQVSAATIDSGDNAWMLASCALVLMMTAPGLILFYGGLVRAKNVLATMMHSLILMALVSMVWMIFGYSMSFAPGNAFVGNPLTYLMLNGVGGAPNPDYSNTVPQETFMLFQMMFAIITPALISGAVAERIKFKGYIVFVLLWVTVVYFPLCHMVWGKGGFFNWALGGRIPALDFAGGTVVHISSGISALVCAIMLGRRAGYPHGIALGGLVWV